MIEDDLNYYRHRAEIERERARHAVSPKAAQVHSELANVYVERIVVAEATRQFVHA